MTESQIEPGKNRRLTLDLDALTLEEILHLAAAGEYEPETGDLIIQLGQKQAKEISAAINCWLKDRSIIRE